VKKLLPLLFVAACGGPKAQDPTTLIATPDAAATTVATVPPALTGARMPPPFHLDSKHIDKKAQEIPAKCRALSHDPKVTMATIAQACGLKAEGNVLNGQQQPTQDSPSIDLKGAKGQCYRIAAIAQPAVKSLVVTLMDQEGAIAAEYHTDDITPVAMPEESLCFKDDAVLKMSASVGSGSGAFSVQALKE
jgi:hypothetical protein